MSTRTETVAADLIGQIRRTSGLTQTQLAERSGLDRSVLSAYEHARRQPSVAALAQIARGVGLELDLTPSREGPSLEHSAKVLSMVLDLAGSLPFKGRGELEYPPLIRLRT